MMVDSTCSAFIYDLGQCMPGGYGCILRTIQNRIHNRYFFSWYIDMLHCLGPGKYNYLSCGVVFFGFVC